MTLPENHETAPSVPPRVSSKHLTRPNVKQNEKQEAKLTTTSVPSQYFHTRRRHRKRSNKGELDRDKVTSRNEPIAPEHTFFVNKNNKKKQVSEEERSDTKGLHEETRKMLCELFQPLLTSDEDPNETLRRLYHEYKRIEADIRSFQEAITRERQFQDASTHLIALYSSPSNTISSNQQFVNTKNISNPKPSPNTTLSPVTHVGEQERERIIQKAQAAMQTARRNGMVHGVLLADAVREWEKVWRKMMACMLQIATSGKLPTSSKADKEMAETIRILCGELVRLNG